MVLPITEYPQYFTAINLVPIAIGRKKLLKPDKYKDIIINSLRFLAEENRAKIFAFVIMNNHIHLSWQMMADCKLRCGNRLQFVPLVPACR
jgi:putative transposase